MPLARQKIYSHCGRNLCTSTSHSWVIGAKDLPKCESIFWRANGTRMLLMFDNCSMRYDLCVIPIEEVMFFLTTNSTRVDLVCYSYMMILPLWCDLLIFSRANGTRMLLIFDNCSHEICLLCYTYRVRDVLSLLLIQVVLK